MTYSYMHSAFNYLFMFALCMGCMSSPSSDLTIQGHVKNSTEDLEFYLFETLGNVRQRLDTIKVVDGSFMYKLKLKESPTQLRLSNNKNRERRDFWVESGNVHLLIDSSSFHNTYLEGMGFYKDEDLFLASFDRSLTLNEKIQLFGQYIDAPSAIYHLYRIYREVPHSDLESLVSTIDEKWHGHDYFVTMSNYLQLKNAKPPRPGAKFIDFEAWDNQKNDFVMSEFLDQSDKQFCLLEFKNLYCPFSNRAIKELSDIQEEFGDKVEFISFLTDTREFLWDRYLSRDTTSWMKLWDGQGEKGETCVGYGAKGSPYYYLMDTEGLILDYWSGYEPDSIRQRISTRVREHDN